MLRLKRFWYTISSNYFIVRSRSRIFSEEEQKEHLGVMGECYESKYCYYNRSENKFEWIDRPKHVFSFKAGVVLIFIFRRRFRKTDYKFMLESYADTKLMEHCLHGNEI